MSNVVSTISGVPQTFSSWDNCMAKSYCKYPAIIGIAVAALIALSVVWCVASCLCCGASLCASCVRCLTCFGCCGMCGRGGGGGGGGSRRYKDDYAQMPPAPYNGYQPQPAPMTYAHAAPQFATFDGPSKQANVHADSLPAMPTWESATSRRVEDHSEPAQPRGQDVEMGRVGPPPRTTRGGYSQVASHAPLSPGLQSQSQIHAYNSDLGAQRLHNNSYDSRDNFTPVSMSPAPTYATNPPQHLNTLDSHQAHQFASGAMSPTPREYNNQQRQQQFPQSQLSRQTPQPTGYRQPPQQQQQQYQQQPPQQPVHPRFQQFSQGSYAQPPQSPSSFAPTPTPSTQYVQTDYDTYRPRSVSPPILVHPIHQQQQRQVAGYNNYTSHSDDQYQQQQQQPRDTRPPSILQVGRKPVTGSQREV